MRQFIMSHWYRVTAAIFAIDACTDASFSSVEISQYEQLGLQLTFMISWDTAANISSGSDLIDIWLQTRQSDPASFAQTALEKGIENTGSLWIDAGDSWAARSSWDNTTSGQAVVCVYNSTDLSDNACSEALGIVPEAEALTTTPGEGINNVEVQRVAQNGSSLAFSLMWADGGGTEGLEDTALLVDIWLTAQQTDPPAWVERAVKMNAENDGLSDLEVDMEWSMMGWDLSRGGQLQSCVYDAQDYENYACSEFVDFTAAYEEEAFVDSSNTVNGGSEGSKPGGRGTMVALVVAGGLFSGLVVWLAVNSSLRRRRRKWVGTANEAEALPEEVFIRPSEAYSNFR